MAMNQPTATDSVGSSNPDPLPTLSSSSEFLSPCPKFGVLVLGNPESTKQEFFSSIFGVDLEKKLVADAFSSAHDIEKELDLQGQNERLAIYTSPNFGTDDEGVYSRVCDFLADNSAPPSRVHCIWYCVASEEDRPVHALEERFFTRDLASLAAHTPLVLVFTKYDEFVSQVQLDWSRQADHRGLSKVAVSHILRDLTAKRFAKQIGKRWDDVESRSLIKKIPRVCVASRSEVEDDGLGSTSFYALATATLDNLRERSVKTAFAAAQRNSASVATRFCADTAAEYFAVDTGHARKLSGVDMRDIMPNFFAKAVQIFNMRDSAGVLTDSSLLGRVLEATFDPGERLLLDQSLHYSTADSGTMLLSLSPHERAVLLTQALAGIVLFLYKLADTQWPHEDFLSPYTLSARTLEHALRDISSGHEKGVVLETVEASPIFASCQLKSQVADLIARAVEQAEDGRAPNFVANGRHASSRAIIVEDDADLQEISMSFVNDKNPDDMVLPCGLSILRLN
ncbi:hypothetical protein B0T26DRAFT_733121 [Lasiosphaeria miniovina]|uniref:Uncharacterized protein n=1 Tax=Lasiosphaeria miniovina TaxID=1954250 RepID=A0AA40DHM0_9PEZI|nr:uncharacterized protein B0T26DRAFT_733121 [Lasiosphaeria miniovina]KAK0703879.1 hypothetical protein B0T26DRAFT_733121 [Lasiosphaeria miniovina]